MRAVAIGGNTTGAHDINLARGIEDIDGGRSSAIGADHARDIEAGIAGCICDTQALGIFAVGGDDARGGHLHTAFGVGDVDAVRGVAGGGDRTRDIDSDQIVAITRTGNTDAVGKSAIGGDRSGLIHGDRDILRVLNVNATRITGETRIGGKVEARDYVAGHSDGGALAVENANSLRDLAIGGEIA